jgi:hypothetical protein
MSIRAEDKIEVCKYCLSLDLDGIQHGRWVSDGTEDGADVVCLWPCNHAVFDRREPRCLCCQPYTPEEMPF